MDLFGKKKNVIGVDIGSSAIKIVELKDTKKGYQLVNYGIAPIPSEVIVDGAIMDSFAIVEAIKMIVAVKKDMINDYTAVMSEAGLNAVVVDVDSFALENMYCINYDVAPEETVALVNLWANVINKNILKGVTTTLTRDVSAGGRQITNEIQKQGGLSFEG